jgi:phosphohistidine swiveling domain-containing protein
MNKNNYEKMWSRDYSVQYCETAMRCYSSEARPHIIYPIDDSFFISEQHKQSFYVSKRQFKKFEQKLTVILKNNNKLNLLINKFNLFGTRYTETSKQIGSLKLKNLSELQLADLHNKYTRICYEYCSYLAALFSLSNISSHLALEILNNKKFYIEDVKNVLLSPSKNVGILELHAEIQKIKSQQKILKKIQASKLLEQFCWISCLDIHNSPWKLNDIHRIFKESVPSIKAIKFLDAAIIAKLNRKQIEFFSKVKELAYLRDMRDVYRRQGIYYILPFYNEIARRLKLNRKEVAYLTNQEIQDGLKFKHFPSKSVITKRQSGFNLININGKIIVPGEEKFYNNLVSPSSKIDFNLNKLTGTVASSGTARGIVKIVLNVHELKKVKKNNILISVTTHPDFLSAMQKAAAIVTDEGGITNHAAIVSRELNKPCIIGTKIATKVFKDGDLVEVDANKGIIRKIDN